MKLNDKQKESLYTVLSYNERFLSYFYDKQKSNKDMIIEIYKSILDPDHIIKATGSSLDFSFFNDIKKMLSNQDKLLPLTSIKTPQVHENAYSIWAIINGNDKAIRGFNFIKDANPEVVIELQRNHPDKYKDVYTAHIQEEVKKFSREWLENRVKELEQGRAIQQEAKNNNENISLSIFSSTSSTQSNTPESRPKTPDPSTFVGKLAIQDEKAKGSSNQRE